MKRTLSLLLALVLLLPGCGAAPKEEDQTTEQDAETILRVVLEGLDEKEETDLLEWYLEPKEIDAYLTGFYELEDLDWSDGAIVRMEGARAFELAVLFVDEGDVDPTVEALQDYLLDRKGSFTGYFPDQAALLDDALILTKSQCVALAVCQDPEAAQEGFDACFGDGAYAKAVIDLQPGPGTEPEPEAGPEPETGPEQGTDPDPGPDVPEGRIPFTPPGKDDMSLFDSSAILSAWESGDDRGLSEKDRAVLEAARAVFDQCVTPDMSDYDKELALYTWLAGHVRYDQSHYLPQGAPRTAYEPYGPLIDGKGVCLGFASTFQLFMDMAGIECITVVGAAFSSREDHAWNMVRLDGQWYCADATWDLFRGIDMAPEGFDFARIFSYFNVTSQYMADTDHQWDYSSVPEAAAEDGGRP